MSVQVKFYVDELLNEYRDLKEEYEKLSKIKRKSIESLIEEITESEKILIFLLDKQRERYTDIKSQQELYEELQNYIYDNYDEVLNINFYEEDSKMSILGFYKEYFNAIKEGFDESQIEEKRDNLVKFVRRNYNLKSMFE